MPAVIHCVRHAQGFHNLGSQFHKLPDPKLTPVGVEQCLDLKNKLWHNQSELSLIASSPLSRTIQTATLVFGPALANGKAANNILAIPDAQETSDFPCDIGSDADVLTRMCVEHEWPVDLSLVQDGWNLKTIGSRYSPASMAVKARARAARCLLRQKISQLEAAGEKDPQVVLVSHGGYLHYFTEDWEDSNRFTGTGWANCETRSYEFECGSDDPDAHLVETMASRARRGLAHPMLPKDQQMNLFKKSMEGWKDQGLQDGSTFDQDNHTESSQSPMEKKVELQVAA